MLGREAQEIEGRVERGWKENGKQRKRRIEEEEEVDKGRMERGESEGEGRKSRKKIEGGENVIQNGGRRGIGGKMEGRKHKGVRKKRRKTRQNENTEKYGKKRKQRKRKRRMEQEEEEGKTEQKNGEEMIEKVKGWKERKKKS